MGRGALALFLDTLENREVAGGAGVPFTHGNLASPPERSRYARVRAQKWRTGSQQRVKSVTAGMPLQRNTKVFTSALLGPFSAHSLAGSPVGKAGLDWCVLLEELARSLPRPHSRRLYRAVREHVDTGIDVMPVVKADAYGHGAF